MVAQLARKHLTLGILKAKAGRKLDERSGETSVIRVLTA